MTDDQCATIIPHKRFLQHSQTWEVEIIGRLIEDQKVSAPLEYLCQEQASPLTTGELVDGLIGSMFWKLKAFEISAGIDGSVTKANRFISVGDDLQNRSSP